MCDGNVDFDSLATAWRFSATYHVNNESERGQYARYATSVALF